jgi:hypothetical protein
LSKNSGYTNLPQRLIIKDVDDRKITYPTIARDGDPNFTGKFTNPFVETTELNFVNQEIVAGAGIPTGSRFISDLLSSPNQGPDIIVNASPALNAFNANNFFYQQENDSQNIKPFIDSRIDLQQTPYYLTGTSDSELPGFISGLGSKIQVVIDISSNEDRILMKKPLSFDILDAGGEYFGQEFTGFCYYNFNTKKWDQIGLSDPQTGADIHYDYAVEVADYGADTQNSYIVSGTNNFPQQFKPVVSKTSKAFLNNSISGTLNALNKTGVPTITSLAPFKTTYHATSSQTIKMSDYINSPLLVEKIIVDLPITARRIWPFGDTAIDRARSASWRGNNYMFFIYRQQRYGQDGQDSATDVTGSTRYIVASGSITTYNSEQRATDDSSYFIGDYNPVNVYSPAVALDFGVDLSSLVGLFPYTAEITQSVKVEMIPGVSPIQIAGTNRLPSVSQISASPSGENFARIFDYWPGGTTCLPFFELASGFTGKNGVSASYAYTGSANDGKTFLQIDNSIGTTNSQLPIQFFDARTFRSVGGVESVLDAGDNAEKSGENSVISPYLLFPHDELVFGFDAGIGEPLVDHNGNLIGNYSYITGSQLTIKAGEAKITFFGSQIQSGKENLTITNQPLVTDAIHEALDPQLVVDQYQIENEYSYVGSRKEEYVAGGYGITAWDNQFASGDSGDRRVIYRNSDNNLGFSGSLQRFDQHVRYTDISEDTGMPTRAVYRYDQYGQFSDMLDSPLDTKFSEDKSNEFGLIGAPIMIEFYRDGVKTEPLNTYSQNLSPFATSSIIYSDNPESTLENPEIGQDRPDNPDVALDEYLEIS